MFKILDIFIRRKSCFGLQMSWDAQFKSNLSKAISRSSLRSQRAIAKAADLSTGQISGILNDQKRFGPGLYTVADLCRALETDPNTLLGFQRDGRPDHNALVSAWVDRKILEDLKWAEDYFDTYAIPRKADKKLKMLHLGKRSLAAKSTGITSRSFFQLTMNAFSNKNARASILDEYCSMQDTEIKSSIETLDVPALAHLKVPVKIRYERLLLRAFDQEGQPVVVNFSTRL